MFMFLLMQVYFYGCCMSKHEKKIFMFADISVARYTGMKCCHVYRYELWYVDRCEVNADTVTCVSLGIVVLVCDR